MTRDYPTTQSLPVKNYLAFDTCNNYTVAPFPAITRLWTWILESP